MPITPLLSVENKKYVGLYDQRTHFDVKNKKVELSGHFVPQGFDF